MTSTVESVAVADRIQDGVYFRSGQRPGACYRLLLLNVASLTTVAATRQALSELWAMLQRLRDGVVADLQGTRPSDPGADVTAVPGGDLTVLLGYGARLFDPDLHVPRLTAVDDKPAELVRLRRNGVGVPFPTLPWAPDELRQEGEADLALQFIADREVTVNRAVVEVAKLVTASRLPLELVGVQAGFQRDDGRSWLGFHDGVNNLPSSQRRIAIEAATADPAWMQGGSYMAILRVLVDLPVWHDLTREQQELLVGRHKLTGCPLTSAQPASDNGADCPPAIFRDPPKASHPVLQHSHIHRANHNRGAPDTDANNRIFRQGYEFLDWTAGGLRVGLHFVSFQRNLARLTAVLRLPGWLGDVNFGGPPHSPPLLLSVLSGGLYAVPPSEDPFPGAALFP
jgi:Dyp-type peroxidase family